MEDQYLRERRQDIEQVVERVLKALAGAQGRNEPLPSAEHNLIVVCARPFARRHDPLQAPQGSAASSRTSAGVTSHTAIVARSLNIPALVGLHHARHMIRENDLLIVDGLQGVLVVDPDPVVLGEYRLRQSQHGLERQKLKRLKSTPSATLDGTPVELFANIELPQDLGDVQESGAQGVGLFRTEFLFHEPQGAAERGGAVRGLPRRRGRPWTGARW